MLKVEVIVFNPEVSGSPLRRSIGISVSFCNALPSNVEFNNGL